MQKKFFLELDFKWLVYYFIIPGGNRMECAVDYVTYLTLVGIWKGIFSFSMCALRSSYRPSAWFTALPPCVRVCSLCVWSPVCVSDASGADSRSIRLPFKCRSARASECLLALPLPPAPRTAPPAAATDRWARLMLHHDSGHEEPKHIFILVNLSAESFASWRNK